VVRSFRPVLTSAESKSLKRSVSDFLSTQEDGRISRASVTQLGYDFVKMHGLYK
jgi:hypothetical protein